MSNFNPAEVSEPVRPVVSESLPDDTDAIGSSADDEADESFEPPAREGLPTTYRMRAERHYVDELVAPRDQSEAGGDSPAGAEASDTALLDQVSAELAAIESATALLADAPPGAARAVALDLIRLQARRASWLLATRALVAESEPPSPRSLALGPLLSRVRHAVEAECRLAGVTLHVQSSDSQAPVTVDEDRLEACLVAAVLATIGVMDGGHGAVLRMTVVAVGGELRSIELRQDAVAASRIGSRRFFDPDWSDRPGGASAAVAAQLVRVTARQQGGDASFRVRDCRGTTLRLAFGTRRGAR